MIAGVVAGGGLLAACSSSASPPTTTAAPSTTAAPGSTTTSTSSSSSSSTTSTGPVRCATSALTGSVVGSSGAAGTIETTLALKSTAAAPCTLGGYPGLQLLGPGRAALPTTVVRKGNYVFTSMAPTTVSLTQGQSAYFNIGYSDVPTGGSQAACPTSTSLVVTPPNAFDSLTVTAALAPCGGGTLTVSPVFADTGANTQTTAAG